MGDNKSDVLREGKHSEVCVCLSKGDFEKLHLTMHDVCLAFTWDYVSVFWANLAQRNWVLLNKVRERGHTWAMITKQAASVRQRLL